jgi:DNA-binding NarL/FixJ family response regulator
MISIIIVDDHPLVGEGVSTMIRSSGYHSVVAICKNAIEAIAQIKALNPEVILLDINLPDQDGIELCSIIRKFNTTTKIIGLTSTNEAGIISAFLANGGNGYLLKNMEREELIKAMDEVMNGSIYLSKAANQKILEQFNSVRDAVHSRPVLTRREKEILHLLYEGLTGPQIAGKLFLSNYTVETHRKNLMQKLNVNSTQQLIRLALEQKLLT